MNEPGSATIDDFERLDIRVGRIVEAAALEGARRPAYRLVIDFGAAGTRQSSAQLVATSGPCRLMVGYLFCRSTKGAGRAIASAEPILPGGMHESGCGG